jgi:mono/diheme cytochrome c family protein
VVLILERGPNANAHAERFVRSIKDECLDRIIPMGEYHFRRAVAEYVEHYHRERNHQGLDNRLIADTPTNDRTGRVRRPTAAGRVAQFLPAGGVTSRRSSDGTLLSSPCGALLRRTGAIRSVLAAVQRGEWGLPGPAGVELTEESLDSLPAPVVECAGRGIRVSIATSRRRETRMKKGGAGLSMLLMLAVVAADAQNASGPSIWGGVFTAAQAKRGDDAYQASCSACHGSDLRATDPEAVNLTGPAFAAKWSGKTLGERFETIRNTMPPGNSNSLGDKTYVDILAFILQFNEFPPGDQELVPETAKTIVFVQKP